MHIILFAVHYSSIMWQLNSTQRIVSIITGKHLNIKKVGELCAAYLSIWLRNTNEFNACTVGSLNGCPIILITLSSDFDFCFLLKQDIIT